MSENLDGAVKGRKRPAPRGTAFYPRQRANHACQVCRARKTKCDNRKPCCSYCLSVGAVCNKSPVDLSSFDPASLKILERLDTLEQVVRQQHLETRSTLAVPLNQTAGTGHHSNITPQRGQSVLPSPSTRKARFLSVLPASPELLLRLPIFRCPIPLPEEPLIEGPFTRAIPATQERQGMFTGLDTTIPGGVNALLDNFFEYVHCKNPVLEEAPTRQLVLSVALEGADWSARSCLALVVCALGRLATPFWSDHVSGSAGPGSAAYTEAHALFQGAQRRMGFLMVPAREDDNDLIASQCLLLSSLYMMCRMYTSYEQHDDPTQSSQSAPSARDSLEQAVYWSAWKSEHELRYCLRLPDFPVAGETTCLYPPLFPTPPAAVSSDSVGEQRQRSSWLFYLAEISLRRLMSRLYGEIATLYSSLTTHIAGTRSTSEKEMHASFLAQLAIIVPEYEEQGRQWAARLPAGLSLEAPAQYDDVCRFVLRGHYTNYRQALYWPFLAHCLGCYSSTPNLSQIPSIQPVPPETKPSGVIPTAFFPRSSPAQVASPSPSTQNPGSRSSATTYLAGQCLEVHVLRVHIDKPGFRHRHHGTLLLLYECVRSAIVLLAAALTGLQMPCGWQDAVVCISDDLIAVWETEMPWLVSWRTFLVETLSQAMGGHNTATSL
ncbi:hypothetical protein BDW59DRAFT_159779 [Aspergillus cavernicola]|uniref:Zn(2)-C6 fungal-type domain-containing protein n=1 Tax=Aspergillus cavernicola TaxID=176166 RepID=A0ABR4IKC0_9EURO